MDSFKMIRLLSPTLLLDLVALALGLPMAFFQQDDGKGRRLVESPACHCQGLTLDFEREVQNQPPREFVFSPSLETERHEWRVESDRGNQVLVRKLVEHRRDKIKVYLDNEAIIIEKETHFHKAGRVGLYANENAQTSFDDFEVRSMGENK